MSSPRPDRAAMSGVSRETVARALAEHVLPAAAPDQVLRLLDALAAEPDPHTTVAEPSRALDIHVRDSLSALSIDAVAAARSIADIGSGAGFPGLPLAIALPGTRIDLVEAASRKCAVIERLAAAAGISNARAVHARAEDWARSEGAAGYDVATARAVAPLAVLVEYAAPLLIVGGAFVAWKGAVDRDELDAAGRAARELGLEVLPAVRVTPYPGARDLHLYLYSKVRETPSRYPRKAGLAAKRPLGAYKSQRPPLT